MNDTLKSLAVIINPILLGIIGVMLMVMLTNNTKEHDNIREELKGKVSNEVLIQYMKLQEEQFKNQQRINDNLTGQMRDFENNYLYLIERSVKKKRIINYMDLGSFICKYDYSLITIFDKNI